LVRNIITDESQAIVRAGLNPDRAAVEVDGKTASAAHMGERVENEMSRCHPYSRRSACRSSTPAAANRILVAGGLTFVSNTSN